MNRPTRRERLRYAFDNFMARGTVALIVGLFVASVLIILIISTVVAVVGVVRDHPETRALGFPELVWRSLLRTLDPGTMGADEGSLPFLAAMLAVTLGGIFVVATLIGLLTTGIESKLAELRKGRSRVLESGHTIIFGWSQQIFSIVSELAAANANQRGACVVILADRDKVEMEDAIRTRVGDTGGTRVVCRSGSPIDLDEIDIANVQTSRSAIVLSPEGDDPDADVIKTLLAITNDPNRRAEPYHVVAELHDPRNVDVARMVGRDEVELVLVGELIARITAQTCRQPGLSVVYTELLDFAGDEIYFAAEPALAGRTFGEALSAYEDSTVIGLAPAGGQAHLNPPMDTVIGPHDRLIVISEDDDTIRLSGLESPPIALDAIREAMPREVRPERTLVLGWNWRGPSIVRELDDYVASGSRLMVVADVVRAAADVDAIRPDMRNQAIDARLGDTTDRRTLDGLDLETYDHVILLSYAGVLDEQRADARTLVTLLHLRDIASRSGRRFSIVSEMLDIRNRALAEVTRADDFIVSDKLVSLYLSQLAENKALHTVFADLFHSAGSEIYLRAASDYVEPRAPVDFYTIVEAARRRSEVALGYRERARANDAGRGYGVVVNPAKSRPITFAPDDRIIVLAES